MLAMMIGRNVKRLMEPRGWQQADLARRCQVSEASISRIISGEQTNPTVRTLAAMAAALECPVSHLLAEPASPPVAADSAEAVMVDLYRLLSSNEQAKVLEYAEAIAIKRERDQFLAAHPDRCRRRTDSPLLLFRSKRSASR